MKMISAAALIFLSFLCGCHIIEPVALPQGQFYLNPHGQISSVSRVVLLELENQSSRPEMAEVLTQALADGLSKKHLFSVRTVHRSDELWTTLNLDHITSYSYEDLASIQETLLADAVVFGTIKRYTSYPHLLMALHLKMINVRNGELIWAIEDVWDSTDRNVELRMKRFFAAEMRTGYEPLEWKILITSPLAFNKFVVYEVTSTLPQLSGTARELLPDERKNVFLKAPEKNLIKTAKNN